jgi:uncharacterized membrane protein
MTRLSLAASLLLLFLLPLLFGQLMAASLIKLHLGPGTAVLLTFAIIFGGMVNIPVKRIQRDDGAPVHPFAVFGFYGRMPRPRRVRRETVIAVNLGGCVIPAALAIYELVYLGATGAGTLAAAVAAAAINTAVCYRLARPVANVGILLPGLVPPLVAVVAALLLAPASAPPVAFVAGVAGTLIGADLLHLGAIERTAVGVASIGGAGTFDGIVLSGIVAAYLA